MIRIEAKTDLAPLAVTRRQAHRITLRNVPILPAVADVRHAQDVFGKAIQGGDFESRIRLRLAVSSILESLTLDTRDPKRRIVAMKLKGPARFGVVLLESGNRVKAINVDDEKQIECLQFLFDLE